MRTLQISSCLRCPFQGILLGVPVCIHPEHGGTLLYLPYTTTMDTYSRQIIATPTGVIPDVCPLPSVETSAEPEPTLAKPISPSEPAKPAISGTELPIAIGQTWCLRNGELVTITSYGAREDTVYPWSDEDGHTWRTDGHFINDGESLLDLIELVTPPVTEGGDQPGN